MATELLFPRNHQLRPWDVGALLSGGIWDVPVWERVTVRIIPTGDEVLDFTTHPDPGKGQVVESIPRCWRRWPVIGLRRGTRRPRSDNPEALHQALKDSLDAGRHLTIFCAGSSAGSKDFTRATLEKEGEILTHGIAAMPGKPSLLANCRGRLVAGAPGYPVSALVCFKELLEPLISWLSHREPPAKTRCPRRADPYRAIPSGRRGACARVHRAGRRQTGRHAARTRGRGTSPPSPARRGDVRIPEQAEGLNEHAVVPAELSVSEAELDRILVCVGSHDNTLDLLADELMGLPEPFRFASTHVGSMGGITALKNGSCHLSGMHLFDPGSDDFNFPFIKKFLPDVDVTVINLAIRHQGHHRSARQPDEYSGHQRFHPCPLHQPPARGRDAHPPRLEAEAGRAQAFRRQRV